MATCTVVLKDRDGTVTTLPDVDVSLDLPEPPSSASPPTIRVEPTSYRWVCFVDGYPKNCYGETPELALQAMQESNNE